MSVLNRELRAALVAAGAPEEKAEAAAESVAAYETRFAKIETDLNLLKWMVGFNLAATVGLIMLQLR